jgi:pilus assembly protein Flp/PilA
MKKVSSLLTVLSIQLVNRMSREAGQGLTEYALILALIAVLAIAALTLLGGKVSDVLSTVGRSV